MVFFVSLCLILSTFLMILFCKFLSHLCHSFPCFWLFFPNNFSSLYLLMSELCLGFVIFLCDFYLFLTVCILFLSKFWHIFVIFFIFVFFFFARFMWLIFLLVAFLLDLYQFWAVFAYFWAKFSSCSHFLYVLFHSLIGQFVPDFFFLWEKIYFYPIVYVLFF